MRERRHHHTLRPWPGVRFALACLALFWLAAAEGASSSASFQLLSHTAAIGTNNSGSGSFRLQSCVNAAPTGSGSSASFRLQSGCLTVLQAVNNALPPVPPGPAGKQVPIPSGSNWVILLMALALLVVAARHLRGRSGHTA